MNRRIATESLGHFGAGAGAALPLANAGCRADM
ncbi:hypothetical protein L902_16250 [Agrobacterium radiobacter DSM 30147]|nr:hypothetical protein L902_16250 [Agrobacterium radiobacter DSM 30147]